MKGTMKLFHDLKHEIDNQGDKLVITLSGDKEKIAKVEKALKAMRDLHQVCGDECCHGEHCC